MVLLVFALVAILVLQTWQRVEVAEAMRSNRHLARELSRLDDLVVEREMQLERRTSRVLLIARAERELGLRPAGWADVVLVADSSSVCGSSKAECFRPDAEGGGEM